MLRGLAEATSFTCLQGGNLGNKHRTKELWLKWSYCKVCRGVTLQHTTALFLVWTSFVHGEGAVQADTSAALTACCCQKRKSLSLRPRFPTFSPALQVVWSHPLHCTDLALIWPLSESVEFVKPTKTVDCFVGLVCCWLSELNECTLQSGDHMCHFLRGSVVAYSLGGSEGEEIEGWTA